MRRRGVRFLAILLILISFVFAGMSRQTINFQGYLTDKNSQPVFGTRKMSFNFYDDSGTLLAAAAERPVTLYNGNYATKIELTDTAMSRFAENPRGQVWVEVIMNDLVLAPRIQMVSVPFAANVRGIPINEVNEVAALTLNGTIINKGVIVGGDVSGITMQGAVFDNCLFNGLTVKGSAATFSGNLNTTTGKIKQVGADLVPKGIIMVWATNAPPAGWALCDGQNGRPNLTYRCTAGAYYIIKL